MALALPSSNQTSWIAAALFIGFFVYVTIKGQLGQFQQAVFGGQQSTGGSTTSTNTAASTTSSGATGTTAAAPAQTQ